MSLGVLLRLAKTTSRDLCAMLASSFSFLTPCLFHPQEPPLWDAVARDPSCGFNGVCRLELFLGQSGFSPHFSQVGTNGKEAAS